MDCSLTSFKMWEYADSYRPPWQQNTRKREHVTDKRWTLHSSRKNKLATNNIVEPLRRWKMWKKDSSSRSSTMHTNLLKMQSTNRTENSKLFLWRPIRMTSRWRKRWVVVYAGWPPCVTSTGVSYRGELGKNLAKLENLQEVIRTFCIDARSFCLYVKGLFGMSAYQYAPTGVNRLDDLLRLQGLSHPYQAASYFFLNISDYI